MDMYLPEVFKSANGFLNMVFSNPLVVLSSEVLRDLSRTGAALSEIPTPRRLVLLVLRACSFDDYDSDQYAGIFELCKPVLDMHTSFLLTLYMLPGVALKQLGSRTSELFTLSPLNPDDWNWTSML